MRYWSVLWQLPSKFIPPKIFAHWKRYRPLITSPFQQLRSPGYVCREAFNECDLPETCTGESGQCPPDVYQKNGSPCGVGYSGMEKATGEAFRGVCSNGINKTQRSIIFICTGYCFNGVCPTLNTQCEKIWGYGGLAADKQCYEQFNSKGSMNGHCGMDQNGQYIKCDPE